MVTLISKWPGISKIYQPILDYRMLCVLSNDHLFFGSSHGTPSRILIMVPIQFMAKFKSTFFKLKNRPSEGILRKSLKFFKVNISNTDKNCLKHPMATMNALVTSLSTFQSFPYFLIWYHIPILQNPVRTPESKRETNFLLMVS